MAMSMLVLLREGPEGTDLDTAGVEAGALAGLGVTEVTVLRDGPTVAVVLQGWLLDPELADNALAVLEPARPGQVTRVLRPVVQLIVQPD